MHKASHMQEATWTFLGKARRFTRLGAGMHWSTSIGGGGKGAGVTVLVAPAPGERDALGWIEPEGESHVVSLHTGRDPHRWELTVSAKTVQAALARLEAQVLYLSGVVRQELAGEKAGAPTPRKRRAR